jgi:hypothetical protein
LLNPPLSVSEFSGPLYCGGEGNRNLGPLPSPTGYQNIGNQDWFAY